MSGLHTTGKFLHHETTLRRPRYQLLLLTNTGGRRWTNVVIIRSIYKQSMWLSFECWTQLPLLQKTLDYNFSLYPSQEKGSPNDNPSNKRWVQTPGRNLRFKPRNNEPSLINNPGSSRIRPQQLLPSLLLCIQDQQKEQHTSHLSQGLSATPF